MCNYSSLSSHVDKMFDIILKGGEEWGVCKKILKKKSRREKSLCAR